MYIYGCFQCHSDIMSDYGSLTDNANALQYATFDEVEWSAGSEQASAPTNMVTIIRLGWDLLLLLLFMPAGPLPPQTNRKTTNTEQTFSQICVVWTWMGTVHHGGFGLYIRNVLCGVYQLVVKVECRILYAPSSTKVCWLQWPSNSRTFNL